MVTAAKKLFYPVDEACTRLGLSTLDLAVLAAEQQITLSTAVPGLLVEEGRYEDLPDGGQQAFSDSTAWVRGLVALRPDDAWYALRHGSQTIFWLAADAGRYRRIVSGGDEDRGYTVIREEVGVPHTELLRYVALQKSLDDIEQAPRARRGAEDGYDWHAARLEAFRRIYFEGVPESQGALIRHVAAWFARQSPKVPDESTLKRRLRDIWGMFGPEAKPRGR